MSHRNKSGLDQKFLFTAKKICPVDKIKNTIKKALTVIDSARLSEILTKNPYEKMVPFNLWFCYPGYRVSNYSQNNQNLRIRYFNSTMLTPLVSVDNDNLSQLKPFLEKLSLYQPFYPETFYSMWEFLKIRHLNSTYEKFLHIGREDRLGSMEAIIFYHEMNQKTYQYNIYHSWLAGKEMYDNYDGSYKTMVPEINYLEQAYKIKFIRSTTELMAYDFISIDSNHQFSTIFGWKEEEMDLQACLLYLLSSFEHLSINGSMIIRLNLIANQSWNIIFDICYQHFREYVFIRPTITNPLNPEIYLYLAKFDPKVTSRSLYHRILKNLYRQKIYLKFYLDPITIEENPITIKFNEFVDNWCANVTKITKNFNKHTVDKTIDYVNDWHSSNELQQIKHLSKEFNDEIVQCIIKAATLPEIKPILPVHLYKLSFYKRLIEKRAELNYYKRIMDTKPSQIFTIKNSYNKNNYLLTWEQLTNKIDIHKNLKHILRTQYQAEMVTNAWIKMYEIINISKNLLPLKENIKTFHLCEAPGAFISAINHYISNRGTGKLDWYAQTLKQTNNGQETDCALSDYFGLIAAYPERWLFGDKNDYSGDITHSTVTKSYVSNPLLKDIDFMTSDAGLQCDPADLNEQEAYLGKINMGQIICILACLPIGKSAIFKTFLPMSEPLTISLIYLVTNLFNLVTIIKPSSSHSSSSEIYIVLKEYKGIDPNILEILYLMLDDPKVTSKTLLFKQIDKVFFESYMNNIINLINRQIKSLCRNYYYYYHLDEVVNFKKTIDGCTDEWLNLNPVFVLKNRLINKEKEQYRTE